MRDLSVTRVGEFTIRERIRESFYEPERTEWQVWRGRILGRCDTLALARAFIAVFVAKEHRQREILIRRRNDRLGHSGSR